MGGMSPGGGILSGLSQMQPDQIMSQMQTPGGGLRAFQMMLQSMMPQASGQLTPQAGAQNAAQAPSGSPGNDSGAAANMAATPAAMPLLPPWRPPVTPMPPAQPAGPLFGARVATGTAVPQPFSGYPISSRLWY